MTDNNRSEQNWFESGGENYARYRPEYPASLVDFLLSVTSEHHHALDVGCGTGQLTRLLANGFGRVTGIDPSQQQIANAAPHPSIDYRVGPAEQLPAELHDVNLITVAQAAHWFDLPAFYHEVSRIAAPDAAITLISYGVLCPDEVVGERFRQFYYQEIGEFWPPERQLVDNGYRDIYFPFDELAATKMDICFEWDLAAFVGYISTWSAVTRAHNAGQDRRLMHFYHDLRECWGEPRQRRSVRWPVNIRAGRV